MSSNALKNMNAINALSEYFTIAGDLEFGIPWSFHYLRKKLKNSSTQCYEAVVGIDQIESDGMQSSKYFLKAFLHAQKCKAILSVFNVLSVGDPVKVIAAEKAISDLLQQLIKLQIEFDQAK